MSKEEMEVIIAEVEIEFVVIEQPIPRAEKYIIRVNTEKFGVRDEEQTGAAILALVGKHSDKTILKEKLRDGTDKIIAPDELVHLRHHKIEHFFTHPKHGKIEFFVNDDPYFTEKHKLTVNQILEISGHNPSEFYLVKVERQGPPVSFKNKGAHEIHMHEDMKFAAISTGPTPLS
jgi:hypothetical protein